MGQFLDYLASVFTAQRQEPVKQANNHVTFAENSFSQVFGGKSGDNDKAQRLAMTSQSNKRTIQTYQMIGLVSFLIQLSLVTVPKIKLEDFDLLQPEGWQLVTLSLVPLVVYVASIGAMNEINKPLLEGAKLTSKNAGLDLNNNDFIQSLKIIILLMSLCQLSSLFSDQLLWSVVLIIPIWCYQLTFKLAQTEYKRYAPSPKKQWVNLKIAKSSPVKQVQQPAPVEKSDPVPATPRTRTRRAVKNIITGVTEKYQAFEQNVAHQLTQKVFVPLSPKMKTIES